MRTEHHLRKSTLADFAAGRLCEALSLVAASHLAWCRECQKVMTAAAETRQGSLEASSSAAMALEGPGLTALKAMDRLPAAVETAASETGDFGLPSPLAQRLDGRGLHNVAWRKVLPGVAVRELRLHPGAAGQLRLVRMAPGRAFPAHGHAGSELSLVLRGAYHDGRGRYTVGDIADLDDTGLHRPVADTTGECICLVAAEMPPLFSSWSARLWQRLKGL